MIRDMSRLTLNFDLSKFLLCISSKGQGDDDDDNAGRHRTTTRATYRQPGAGQNIACIPSGLAVHALWRINHHKTDPSTDR